MIQIPFVVAGRWAWNGEFSLLGTAKSTLRAVWNPRYPAVKIVL
ncbi:MAG TPA: hypothetical protein PLY97_11920 [Acidocella sp.]|nr:hypothetical protein [Acidocella sp.]